MAALDMAAHADLDQAVAWHLQGNHYPPVPRSMVGPCLEAIALASGGEWDEHVDLPEGVSWRDQTTAPAWAIIEAHHLDPFLTEED
jgi:hypothetical protein